MIHLLFVPGNPVGKGRPRMTKQGWLYTPKKTREYEKKIRDEYRKKFGLALPFGSAIKISIIAYFQKPKKASRPYPPRPDLDNIIKIVLDALNGLAWKDDSQVISIRAEKSYYHSSGLMILIDEESFSNNYIERKENYSGGNDNDKGYRKN